MCFLRFRMFATVQVSTHPLIATMDISGAGETRRRRGDGKDPRGMKTLLSRNLKGKLWRGNTMAESISNRQSNNGGKFLRHPNDKLTTPKA